MFETPLWNENKGMLGEILKRMVKCWLICTVLSSIHSATWAEKITVVLGRSLVPYEQAWDGFVEASAMEVQKLNMRGDAVKGRQIMQNISSDATSLVVTIGSEATMMAVKYLTSVPMIYSMVLKQPPPKKNVVSGLLIQVNMKKQLEVIKQLFPENKRIGVIYNLHYSGAAINQARRIVKELGMNLTPIAIQNQADITEVLQKLTKDEISVLWSVVDRTVGKPKAIQILIKHSLREKIPFMALSQYHVKAGAFAALSVDYRDMGMQTAELAQKAMRPGKRPPVEYPRKLILYVNSETQNKIGIIKIPRLPGVQMISK
ncbi:hypothetical protein KAR34_13805 [bacterium]|nr:hypothetical protein [bacterium]